MPSVIQYPAPHSVSETITSFVDSMSTDLGRYPLSEEPRVLADAQALVAASQLSATYKAQMARYCKLTYQLAMQVYTQTPHDTKVFLTVFCAACYLVDDDMPDELVPSFESFAARFNTGVSHGDSGLDFIEMLLVEHAPKIAGPIALSCLIKGTMDCVVGCLIEKRMRLSNAMPLTREFPVWLRRKLSLSEAVTFLLFPQSVYPEQEYLHMYLPLIPSLAQVIDETNDVLSAYKELVVGDEDDNLIGNLARAQGHSIETVADDLAGGLVALKSRLVKMLTMTAAMSNSGKTIPVELVTSFCDGWIAWHLHQAKRYKLDQLGLSL